ncbi:hypothetical protein ACFXTH_003130 [Malus domestica]
MLPFRPPTAASSTALVKYTPLVFKEEEEDLKIKLRKILKNFLVRFSNTSGSFAGSPLATSIRSYGSPCKAFLQFNMKKVEKNKAAAEDLHEEKKRQPLTDVRSNKLRDLSDFDESSKVVHLQVCSSSERTCGS